MGIFIRTFLVTLVLCLGYYGWVYFSKAGYAPELKISDDAKTFITQTPKDGEVTSEQEEANAKRPKDVKIAFLTNEGKIHYVTRRAQHKTLYTALGLLMKGPTLEEEDYGIFTEIPAGTRVISVKERKDTNSIIINLTKEFGEGGGTQSIQARLNQITETVKLYSGGSDVYLYLDGTEAQYLGGEGIYIQQPINRNF